MDQEMNQRERPTHYFLKDILLGCIVTGENFCRKYFAQFLKVLLELWPYVQVERHHQRLGRKKETRAKEEEEEEEEEEKAHALCLLVSLVMLVSIDTARVAIEGFFFSLLASPTLDECRFSLQMMSHRSFA